MQDWLMDVRTELNPLFFQHNEHFVCVSKIATTCGKNLPKWQKTVHKWIKLFKSCWWRWDQIKLIIFFSKTRILFVLKKCFQGKSQQKKQVRGKKLPNFRWRVSRYTAQNWFKKVTKNQESGKKLPKFYYSDAGKILASRSLCISEVILKGMGKIGTIPK